MFVLALSRKVFIVIGDQGERRPISPPKLCRQRMQRPFPVVGPLGMNVAGDAYRWRPSRHVFVYPAKRVKEIRPEYPLVTRAPS